MHLDGRHQRRKHPDGCCGPEPPIVPLAPVSSRQKERGPNNPGPLNMATSKIKAVDGYDLLGRLDELDRAFDIPLIQ